MSETPADIPPFRYTAALADEIEAPLAGLLGGARHLRRAQPGRRRWPTRRTPAAGAEKLFVLDMFPYPSGAGLHVGHPLGYIGTDVLRPLPAHGRPQRAARDGLRRVRPAGRAVRGADRASTRARPPRPTSRATGRSCAGWAWATTTGARSPPPTSSSTAGPSGSSCRSSTPGTTRRPAKARPIAELVAEFAGRRPGPRPTARPGRRCRRSSGARSSTTTGWRTSARLR